MKLFNPRYSVCAECGVLFDPAPESEKRWGHLCSVHRKPVMERDLKRDAVIRWATANWERLATMMDEENKKNIEAFQQAAIMQNSYVLRRGMQNTSVLRRGMQNTSVLRRG